MTSTNKWQVLAVLAVALFMINLDVTIVNIALPDIIQDFEASIADAEWILNAYVLIFATLLITFGRLGDIYGRRLFFISGLVIFTTASLICALAPSISLLIAGRVLQAVGSAAMMPATLSILNVTFQSGHRGLAMGIWGAVAGAASALGPIIGGLLVDAFSWPSIFLVNIPVGVFGLIAAVRLVPESTEKSAPRRWDVPGIITASVGLASLTFALVEGQSYGWDSATIIGSFALSGFSFASFIVIESKTKTPLIDLKLFGNRSFTAGNALGMIMMFGLIGTIFLLVLYLQIIRGLTAIETGLAVLPMPIVIMMVAPMAGRLADRIPMRIVFSMAMLIIALALFLLSNIDNNVTWRTLVFPLSLAGLGMGLVMAPLGAVVMASAPVSKSGAASGILTTMRQVGAVLGVSVLGAALQSEFVSLTTNYIDELTVIPASFKEQILDAVNSGGVANLGQIIGNNPGYIEIVVKISDFFTQALSYSMRLGAIICVIGALVALLVSYNPKGKFKLASGKAENSVE